ncbi:cilia- and flagella-associated protein 58 isoform X6 [Nilaparvata lugens]|uniref:cilia- and flagella-associated protein 58 isoform X6 n=1 Tax=Nilaparvata lugens TaxID=108931 RepID=UPI00193C9A81|nr:cilia- and flagella-associated protein 58 isoform X6 [Nilaparvata lugens]
MESIVEPEPSRVSDEEPVNEGPAEISDIKDMTDSVDSMYRHSELKLLKEEQVSATPVKVEQSISNEGVNLMENECKDKERPSNKEITLPTAYVKLYRIGVLDRIARTLYQKQRSDDDYDDVDNDYEPSSADSGSDSSAEEEEEGNNEEMVSATPVQVEQSISNEGVNLMENECKDKERPSNKELTLPTAYVKLYRIGVLDRIARTLHQKQRSDDDYDDVDDDYEPSSADSESESSAEEGEVGNNVEMAFIPDKSKEEKAADELFANYPELEAHYKKLVNDLELTITANRFIEDVIKLWSGVSSRHGVLQQFVALVKEQRSTISTLNSEVGDCLRSTKDKQDNVEKLKMEIEKAWRTADATHVREQEALENIENLRQQLSRLQNERGVKSKLDFDQNGEYTTAAKNRELQLKEREKLVSESAELKEKLRALTAEHEDLEQRYSAANMKVAELQQDLENRGNEIMKETQFKGRLQDEINRLTDEMRGRTEEVLVHKLQMTMLNRTANRLEQALKSEKATVDRLTQQQEVLSQRYLKIQDELSIETQLYEEASSKINLLANQLKNKDEELLKLRNDLSRVVKLTESAAVRIEKAESERKRVEEERDALATKAKSLEREVGALNKLRTADERLVEKTARERELERKNCLRLNDELKGLFKRIEVSEQIRQRFQTDNEELCKEILKLRRQIRNLENEMERVQEGEKGLLIKLDGVEENLRSKILDIADLKKQLSETEAVVKQQQALFETVRTEENAIAKELFQCKVINNKIY